MTLTLSQNFWLEDLYTIGKNLPSEMWNSTYTYCIMFPVAESYIWIDQQQYPTPSLHKLMETNQPKQLCRFSDQTVIIIYRLSYYILLLWVMNFKLVEALFISAVVFFILCHDTLQSDVGTKSTARIMKAFLLQCPHNFSSRNNVRVTVQIAMHTSINKVRPNWIRSSKFYFIYYVTTNIDRFFPIEHRLVCGKSFAGRIVTGFE